MIYKKDLILNLNNNVMLVTPISKKFFDFVGNFNFTIKNLKSLARYG